MQICLQSDNITSISALAAQTIVRWGLRHFQLNKLLRRPPTVNSPGWLNCQHAQFYTWCSETKMRSTFRSKVSWTVINIYLALVYVWPTNGTGHFSLAAPMLCTKLPSSVRSVETNSKTYLYNVCLPNIALWRINRSVTTGLLLNDIEID